MFGTYIPTWTGSPVQWITQRQVVLNSPTEMCLCCNKDQRVLSEENRAETVTTCPEQPTATLTWELRNGCDIQKQYPDDRYQLTVIVFLCITQLQERMGRKPGSFGSRAISWSRTTHTGQVTAPIWLSVSLFLEVDGTTQLLKSFVNLAYLNLGHSVNVQVGTSPGPWSCPGNVPPLHHVQPWVATSSHFTLPT